LTVASLLDARGISTSDFAKLADLTYGQALAIRRGMYERIDLNTIGRICDALNVEPGDLFSVEKTAKIEEPKTT